MRVLSAPCPIRAKVPQGSCLSLELYAQYTDDIPTLRGHLENWEDDVMLALYAEDSAYFASSRRADLAAKKIQRVFDLLPEWLDKWRMAVNVNKTAALLTSSQRILPNQLRLRSQAAEWKTCVRYLGVHIDRLLDTQGRRTCGSDATDNLSSRECDRFRKYLRQLEMPSRSRPTPTGANAGRSTRVSATEHAPRAPDRPSRHGTAAATDVLTKRIGMAAHRARRTLNAAAAARLSRCGRRGACPDVVGTILNCEPTLRDAPRRLD
ncbi:RNA-directed DNA polymerase from mobile element jockey [Eumeta japonica]|uniref:RNA-directed DNA polymerase from mobile element jockey n=1 Tax=Eumeta variegata TaxID=151549 RepID=A0A4C1YBL2_EUMVA|nr:RNA-directed DNA polymerase from mobile element jockey [Eumeta japonica]